jgi:hypothetical protein
MISGMSMRFPVGAAVSLLIAFCGSLSAQGQADALELQRLRAAVSVINDEIRANLDEVTTLQQAARANTRALDAQRNAPGPVSYDDMAAAQQRAIDSEAAINARVDAILRRNLALDAEKQPMLERVRALLQIPPAPPQ